MSCNHPSSEKFSSDSPEAKFLTSLVAVAIRDQRLDLVNTICKAVIGPQPQLEDALCKAIVAGQLDVVRAFLCRGPYARGPWAVGLPMAISSNMSVRITTPGFEEKWPLIVIAARSGQSAIVRELLDANADPNRTGELNGQAVTALYLAVQYGFPKTCRAILETATDVHRISDSDPCYRCAPNLTCYRCAPKKNAQKKLRLEFYNDHDRATPLLMAARKGEAGLVSELVGAGASLSAQRLSCNKQFVEHSDGGKHSFLAKYNSPRDQFLSLTPLGTCVYRRWPENSIRALLDMKADPGRAAATRSSSAEDAGLSPSSRGNPRDDQGEGQSFLVDGPSESVGGGDEIPLALFAATALIPLTPNAPVVICGLESETGKKMNGLRGFTVPYDGSKKKSALKDRWGVEVPAASRAGAGIPADHPAVNAIKSENLRAVGDGTIYPRARATGAQAGAEQYSYSDDLFMPQDCLYDPLTAHDSALARTELLLQRGARPFRAPNSRYSFHEFFEELATSHVHRCHGVQYWGKLVKLFLQYEANPERTAGELLLALAAAAARERAVAAVEVDAVHRRWRGGDECVTDTAAVVVSITARAELLLTDVSVDGAAVLRQAVATGRADVVRELCAIAAEARDPMMGVPCLAPDEIMNKFDPERQRTALHYAAEAGQEELVRLLLGAEGLGAPKLNVEVRAQDEDGHTALDLAVENGHSPVVAMLLMAGGQKWGPCLRGDGCKRGPLRKSREENDFDGAEESKPALRKAFEAAVSGQHVGVAWQLLLSAAEEAERCERRRWRLGNRVNEAGAAQLLEEMDGGSGVSVNEEDAGGGASVVDAADHTDTLRDGGAAQEELHKADADSQNSGDCSRSALRPTIVQALHPSYRADELGEAMRLIRGGTPPLSRRRFQ